MKIDNQLEKHLLRVTEKRVMKYEIIFSKIYENIKIEDDDEYIVYKAWEQVNRQSLYKKYNITGCCSTHEIKDKIIFHAGCRDCSSQDHYLIERRCVKCCYFKADWQKEDLSI